MRIISMYHISRCRAYLTSAMKGFFACVVLLCVLPLAFSLKCYECQPDMESIGKVNVTQNMTQEEYQKIVDSMQLCQNPTNVLECPSNNSCIDKTIGLSFKVPVVNFTINVTTHSVNCTRTAMWCSAAAKKMVCSAMKQNLMDSGAALEECDVECCETDLCNEVVTPTVKPSTGTPSATASDGKSSIPTVSKSSVIAVPFGAMFALLAMVLFRLQY